MSGDGPTLAQGDSAARLPAQDLERARRFYAEKLGLEPVEERPGGLRYLPRSGEFALFLTYSLMISGFVYPVLTHWGWSPNGWMIQGFAVGDQRTTYIDFAGKPSL